jgi:membrane protein
LYPGKGILPFFWAIIKQNDGMAVAIQQYLPLAIYTANMKKNLNKAWKMVQRTFSDFSTYKITTLSAALAYYTIFAMAPILIIIIWLCGLFLGRQAIEGQMFNEIKSFVGSGAAAQLQEIIKNATLSKANVLASVVGVVSLVFAATGIFTQIQDSINFIWQLKAKPKTGILKLVINRLISFSMLISLGFLLLVSLFINTLMDAFSARLVHIFPGIAVTLAYIINVTLTFLVISFLFAGIFKVLPDAKIEWRDVRAGAITTAILFMIGKFLITFYMSRAKVDNSYGAAGSIIIILLWVYYSSIILYFGAAFTKEYASFRGRYIYPNDYAVFIQQVEKESKASLQAQPDKQVVNGALPSSQAEQTGLK